MVYCTAGRLLQKPQPSGWGSSRDANMKALILAAGEGRRMQPLSKIIPKPLLPLLNRPVMDRIISSLNQAGISEIGVVVSPTFHFKDLESFNCELFIQEKPIGVGAAILEAENWLDSPSFLVCAGDSIFPSSFLQAFVYYHLIKSPEVTIATEVVSWPKMGEKSCVVHDKQGNVQRIIEKPSKEQATSNLAAAPIFMFKQRFLDELKAAKPSPRGEIEVQESIQAIIDRGSHVASLESPRWVHLSTPYSLFATNMRLLEEETPHFEVPLAKKYNYRPPIAIASSAILSEDVVIGPRAVIGERVRVSSGVQLQDVLVLPDTAVQCSHANGILWPKGFLSMPSESEMS